MREGLKRKEKGKKGKEREKKRGFCCKVRKEYEWSCQMGDVVLKAQGMERIT